MTGIVTYAGLDVHARSTHAAAIDIFDGRGIACDVRAGHRGPVEWLREMPGPVRACYGAGPTGFGLYRAASAAGVSVEVIAPGKTPRSPSNRVKTDRKDAELLARSSTRSPGWSSAGRSTAARPARSSRTPLA